MRRRAMGGDEGFTILEVLFAAFIMFFVLTALLGLTVTSLRMSRSATTESIATQFGNLLIEQARAMPYADVGVAGAPFGQPVGVLPSSETTVFQGVTFTVDREVGWVDDSADGSGGADSDANSHDYKQYTVDVSWQNSSGNGASMTFSTRIRNLGSEALTPPLVEWVTSNVPPEGAVLFNLNTTGLGQAQIWAGNVNDPDGSAGNAFLEALATDPDGVIARLEYWVDGKPLLYGTDYAVWTPNTPSYSNPPFRIDTRATDTSGSALMLDGWHEFKVQAWDETGARDFRTRNYLVDNDPPAWETTATLTLTAASETSSNTALYNSRLSLAWPVPRDGADLATRYDVATQLNLTSVPTTIAYYADLGGSGRLYAPGSGTTLAPDPLQAYKLHLVPRSPRGLKGGVRASNWVITPPRLTGRTVKTGGTANVYLTVAPNAVAPYAHVGCVNNGFRVVRFNSWTGTLASSMAGGVTQVYPATSGEFTTGASYAITDLLIENRAAGAYYAVQARVCVYPNGASFGFPSYHIYLWSNAVGPIAKDTAPIARPQ